MRAFVPVWKDLARRYERMGFRFVIVYIMEAHAQDEWPISSCRHHPEGKRVIVNQHKSIEERMEAAKEFRRVFGLEGFRFLVDDMDNTFNNQFAAWPFRYFVMDKREVKLIGMPDVANDGDTFSSAPLQDFFKFYDFEYNPRQVGGLARMLHYSSGRLGYDYEGGK